MASIPVFEPDGLLPSGDYEVSFENCANRSWYSVLAIPHTIQIGITLGGCTSLTTLKS